jgi:Rrf2 family protein
MIFSSKAEYGVRLMVELGRQTPEQPTSLKAIADAEGLPLAYLEQVVARLKKAGLVMSARGAHGGYWLARDAAEITMFDVVGALEGTIAPMECFVRDEMERVVCSHVGAQSARGCATKLLWTRVQSGIVRSLQTTTLAELVEFSRRSESEPEAGGRLVSVAAPQTTTVPSPEADRAEAGDGPTGRLRLHPAPERPLATVTPLRIISGPVPGDGSENDHDPAPTAA